MGGGDLAARGKCERLTLTFGYIRIFCFVVVSVNFVRSLFATFCSIFVEVQFNYGTVM